MPTKLDCLLYADDIASTRKTHRKMQTMVNTQTDQREDLKVQININKSKSMLINEPKTTEEGKIIMCKQSTFEYLCSELNNDGPQNCQNKPESIMQ